MKYPYADQCYGVFSAYGHQVMVVHLSFLLTHKLMGKQVIIILSTQSSCRTVNHLTSGVFFVNILSN